MLGAAVAASMGGCQSTPPPPVVSELADVTGTGDALTAAVIGEGPAHRVYVPRGGDPSSQRTVEWARAGTGWTRTERTGNHTLTETLVVAGEGESAIERQVDTAEDVIVDFSPPLVIFPARIEVGGSHSWRGHMVVHPSSKPGSVRAEGDATQTLRFTGWERLPLDGGEVEAARIETDFEADLGGALAGIGKTVSRAHTTRWYVPGRGLVAESSEKRTTVGGISVRKSSEAWIERDSP